MRRDSALASALAPALRRVREKLRTGGVPQERPYLLWVKTLACSARHLGPCEGITEADHDNRARGLSQKREDRSAFPMCVLHHGQRTRFTGVFRVFDRTRMHAFIDSAQRETRWRYNLAFPTPAHWENWKAHVLPRLIEAAA